MMVFAKTQPQWNAHITDESGNGEQHVDTARLFWKKGCRQRFCTTPTNAENEAIMQVPQASAVFAMVRGRKTQPVG